MINKTAYIAEALKEAYATLFLGTGKCNGNISAGNMRQKYSAMGHIVMSCISHNTILWPGKL